MTATERQRKRRQSLAEEIRNLRAENERLRKQLQHTQDAYAPGYEHGSMSAMNFAT